MLSELYIMIMVRVEVRVPESREEGTMLGGPWEREREVWFIWNAIRGAPQMR